MARYSIGAAQAAAIGLALAVLCGCTASTLAPEAAPSSPPPSATPTSSTAAPVPPPVDLAGRWKFTDGAVGCFMTFGNATGAAAGTIAPEGGCPGNFFTSRKWTFEHEALVIRDHKGAPLAQLSFADGRFAGQDAGGAALSLSR
jgi:Protease inhibitor Inh